jgi:5-methylcytosine-specific restriction endonuclease McrA
MTTARKNRSVLQKMATFERCGGICHICGGKIDGTREAWEEEHIIPLAMGGEDEDENRAPAHVKCHRAKTRSDRKQISKANRVRAKHNGARKSSKNPIPGSKGSRFKSRLDGTVIDRLTGKPV